MPVAGVVEAWLSFAADGAASMMTTLVEVEVRAVLSSKVVV